MKTAVIQLQTTIDQSANLRKITAFIQQAAVAKAKLIILPEALTCRGQAALSNQKMIVENIPGPTTNAIALLAKKYRAWVILGSIWEQSAYIRKPFNTSVVINPAGTITATYRKRNLFKASLSKRLLNETDYTTPGRKRVVTAIGRFKAGLSICYDLRFPDMYAYYRQQGADILTAPSAFTYETGKAHWDVLLRARAIENLAYMIAPNQVGQDNKGVRCWGHSMIIDPWGKVLAEASEHKEEIIYAELDKKSIREARKKLPRKK